MSISPEKNRSPSSKRSVETWKKMLGKMKNEPMCDLAISAMLEERREIAERLFPEPPSDANSLPLSNLIEIAVKYLNYEPPLPDSYIDENVSIYERWMTAPEGGSLDLKKIERDLELLMILLGSHGITLKHSDNILTNKEEAYA